MLVNLNQYASYFDEYSLTPCTTFKISAPVAKPGSTPEYLKKEKVKALKEILTLGESLAKKLKPLLEKLPELRAELEIAEQGH